MPYYFNNKITFIKNALPDEIISYKIIKENKKYNLAEVTEYKKCCFYRIGNFTEKRRSDMIFFDSSFL